MQRFSALSGGLVAAILCAVAGQATAEDRGRVNAPAFFDNDIGFEVAGTISARCTVDQGSSQASFGDVLDGRVGGNRAAQLDLAFDLSCNSPFRVTMISDNGGLVTLARGGPAFRDRLNYSAVLELNDGRATQACASADMIRGGDRDDRCVFRFRDPAGATGPATVKLSMTADTTPLLGGAYTDRLTVRITPLLGGD